MKKIDFIFYFVMFLVISIFFGCMFNFIKGDTERNKRYNKCVVEQMEKKKIDIHNVQIYCESKSRMEK